MPRYEVPMNGGAPYYLVLYTSHSGRTVHSTMYWRRDATGSSSFNGAAYWSITIAGVPQSGTVNFNAPGGGAIGETYIAGASQYIYTGSNVGITGYFDTDTAAAGAGTIYGSELIAVPPPAPLMFAPDQITATSMRVRFQSQGDGGSPVSSWRLDRARDAAFTQDVVSYISSGTTIATGLTPGVTYYWRARGTNSAGTGAWSNIESATTLALTAPGMTVTPSLSGSSASVALSPPSGLSSVDSYTVQRRPIGGSATSYTVTSPPLEVSGLTPGAVYEWRSRAVVGSAEGPWTSWVTVSQPRPNTNPGDYFDGSSAATDDASYTWDGAASNSTSRAVGVSPAGWRAFSAGSAVSGGAGVVARVTGGRSGPFAARVTFFTDTTAPGFRAGTSTAPEGRVEVAENGAYWGSIYVAPSRAQRMAAQLIWMNAAGAVLGSPATGPSQVVQPLGALTRLAVRGVAPLGAVYAAVGWTDVAGDGWSTWHGGDSVTMDDAMVSIGALYDWFSGDTPDNASWAYSWLGAPNASVSMASAVDPGDVDPLADPDCPPPPPAPRPPAIVDDCIDEVGAWRRYWAIIPADLVSQSLDLVPTIELATGVLPERQVRIRTWPNPDALSPDDYSGTWESEQIVSYLPPRTHLTLDGVAQRVWAEVDGGDPISADRLLYGTGGSPASWPILSCGTGYLVSFDVPLDAPEGNLSVDVALTTRML